WPEPRREASAPASPGSCRCPPWFAALLGADVRIEPVAHGLQVRLRKVTLEQAPHARLEPPISGLVVALPQAGEDAEDARVALGGERPITALESIRVTGRRNVAIDHRPLERLRHLAPRLL